MENEECLLESEEDGITKDVLLKPAEPSSPLEIEMKEIDLFNDYQNQYSDTPFKEKEIEMKIIQPRNRISRTTEKVFTGFENWRNRS